MPQTSDRHGQQQVAVSCERAAAIAAHRDVKVVANPARQGQVPAPPKILDAVRQIGMVEVLWKMETEHLANANGHCAVAGEVEEQLQRVGAAADPGVDQRG